MTKEQAKKMLPIITAFSEGRNIEVKSGNSAWTPVYLPNFDSPPEEYRIAPRQFVVTPENNNCRVYDGVVPLKPGEIIVEEKI